MSQLKSLARVLRDRMAELDRAIIASQSEREVAYLWRLRTGVRKLFRALIGPEK